MQGQSAQVRDVNGYVTIERNPISRVGVFTYSGRSLPDADPEKFYSVYRPAEELSDPATLESFRLIPLVNEHHMLGDGYTMQPEEKGVHGTTGEDVLFDGEVLYAPLRIFSAALKTLIEAGKKALSIGYRCVYEKTSGVFNGQPYDYIQRNIRGNHIALVVEGRSGKDIAVLDHYTAFDHFDLNISNKENDTMADETKAEETKKEPTIAEIMAILEKLMPLLEMADKLKAGAEAAPEKELEVLDEETKEEPGDEKKAMDAVESRLAAVEKRDAKALMAEINHRNTLAAKIEKVVGTFDHAEMTASEVARYGCEKFGLKAAAGQEVSQVEAFIAGREAVKPVSFAQDTKAKSGKFAAALAERNA